MVEAAAQGGAPAPLGVVYNTAMQRPDAALALGALYAFASRRQARVGAVCVTGAGLDTAVFCDVVSRFYAPGRRSSNSVLPVGLANVQPMPPDAPMVKFPVARTKADGSFQYQRDVAALTDTAMAETVMRNGITLTVDSSVLLSAPATFLARSLRLSGTTDQYRQRVRRVVIVESPELASDPDALRVVIEQCPSPLFFVGSEVGAGLRFPGATLDEAFAWAPAHPIADAYRSHGTMPHDAPLSDVAGLYYLVRPDADFFTVSEPGTLSVAAGGTVAFTPSANGTVRRVSVHVDKRSAALEALVTAATSAPAAPPRRGG